VLEARADWKLAISEQHAGKIYLLLTDVMMPHMTGPELVRRLALLRPDMRALCFSGYTDDIALEREGGEASIAFLQKPVSPEALKLKVREVLDTD
jgi:response regulator RpfG family c-di-GMP phosphodiesterase